MMRNQKGFTLIELLIVVVIIGILAAIAIPRFGKTREKAYVAAMQSDLKQVMTMQEMYYGDPASKYSYWAGTITMEEAVGEGGEPEGGGEPGANALEFEVTASEGVTIKVSATDDGWNAVANHTASSGVACDVYVGNTSLNLNAESPGVITCGSAGVGAATE